jgi:hypothetical protein
MARIGTRRRSRGLRTLPLPSVVVATTGGSAGTESATSAIANRRAVFLAQCRDHRLRYFALEGLCLPPLRHAAARMRRGDRRLARKRRAGARTSARPPQLIPARPCEEHQ